MTLIKNLEQSVQDIDTKHILYVVKYLKHYGYLNKLNPNINEFIDAITLFQTTFDLTVDGVVGPQTLETTLIPRCGVPDYERASSNRNKWTKTNLTYYIKNRITNNEISVEDFDDSMEQVMSLLTDVCGLKICRTNDIRTANLVLDTGSSRRDGFGAPGGTLAWAYLPQGDNRQLLMKYDSREPWTLDFNSTSKINLIAVGSHEISHNLGLVHVNDRRALMYPMYQRHIWKPQSVYDIPELQKRYGKPTTQPEPDPEPDPPKPEEPSDPTDPASPSQTFTLKISGRDLKLQSDSHRIFPTA